MDEEKQTNEQPEATTETEDVGDKPTTTPLIDIANAAAERMEKANEETARLQANQAERDARIALGGKSEAGQAPVEKKEIANADYASEVMKGNNPNDK